MKTLSLSLLVLAAIPCASAGEWATREQLAQFKIVVSEDAAPSEKTAAEELQRYWEAVIGVEPPIVHAAPSGPVAWVGFTSVPGRYLGDANPSEFEPQELWVKTLTEDGTPHLVIAGGEEDGTLYGVYQFVEDYLGVRWLAPGTTHISDAPAALPEIDFRYCPVFEYRYSTYFSRIDDNAALAEYMRVHRWRPGPGFSCHTFYRYVPPTEYFEDHPEYFSLVNGKRVAALHNYGDPDEHAKHHTEVGQLCMTEPGVLEVIKQRIEAGIQNHPEHKIHHISQMDWGNYCECDDCRAIDEHEDTHMGSVLWGLNRIAQWLEREHPGHKIETLAYTYTRKPPKHMKPRPNIAIKLCSIECDFSRPFTDTDSELNRPFVEDVEGWSAIANRLHVWDYTTNFRNFQSPQPNFQVLQPNMRFLAAHNVKGMFPQGAYDMVAEFAPLRGYLLSKLMWNPDLDFQATMDEFLELYYGDAAPHVRDYIALLTRAQREHGAPLTCFDRGSWYGSGTVAQARAILAKAMEATGSAKVRDRIAPVNATVEYAALKCPPDLTIGEDTITLSRPDSLTLDAYLEMLHSLGVKSIVDYFPIEYFPKQLNNSTPPRHLESRLLKLENQRYLVWVAPGFEGSILRWYDKKLEAELLAGYEVYGQRGGSWQDWTHTPGIAEHAVATRYEVVEEAPDSITVQARTDAGLLVKRRMTLAGDVFDVGLTLINDTGSPMAPGAKIHPEFWLHHDVTPAIYAKTTSEWKHLNANVRPEETARGEIVEAAPHSRFAAYLPGQNLTIETEVGKGVGQLLYFYSTNRDAQHVNLELLPRNEPIAPGETYIFGGRYTTHPGRPE